MIKGVDTFYSFARDEEPNGEYTFKRVVRICVDAMDKHKLHVCAKNIAGCYLWESFSMELLQWQRVCDILRRQGIGTSVLWSTESSAYHTPLLADLDCLWEDLDVIQASIIKQPRLLVRWISPELQKRTEWKNGLRHAWLAAAAKTNEMIKYVDSFYSFAIAEDNETLVRVCVDAMEKQKLHVCARNRTGHYLWENYIMAPLQWQRVCDIVRQQGIEMSVLWSADSSAYHTPLVADLDCLWEDLDVIQAGINKQLYDTLWITHEVTWRQEWRHGLRRAWLAAVVFAGEI